MAGMWILEDEQSVDSNEDSVPTTTSSEYDDNGSNSPVLGPKDLEFISGHIEFLYSKRQFYVLLDFVWNMTPRMYYLLPSKSKEILARCLFQMGRPDSARRRLSCLIEIESDLAKRRDLVWILITWSKIMGWHETINSCLYDLVYLKSTETYICSDIGIEDESCSFNWEDSFKKLLQEVKGITTKDLAEYEFTPKSVVQQVKEALRSGCALPHKSLGRLCYSAAHCGDRSTDLLRKWNSKQSRSSFDTDNDPLCSLFQFATYILCVPVHLFTGLLKYQNTIKKCIESQCQQLGIDYSKSPNDFEQLLEQWNAIDKSSLHVCEIVSRHRLLLGFLAFLQNDMTESMVHFTWLLELLTDIGSRFKRNTVCNNYLGVQAYITCHTLLFTLRIRSLEEITSEEYESWCLQLLQHAEMAYETHTTFFEGCVGPYLNASAGFCYEERAFQCSDSVTLVNTDQQPAAVTYAKKFQFEDMFSAAKNYLIAAVNKPRDDPTIITMLDRMIWCIILCGGLHLKCLHYFVRIRTHFRLKLDFGPFHIFSKFPYQLIPGNDRIKQYQNGWSTVSQLHYLWNCLGKEVKVDCWTKENSRQLLMPQVFATATQLVIMDGMYCENYFSSFHNKKFEFVSGNNVKPVLKSQIRMPENVIEDHVSKSIELLKLWNKLYYGESISDLEPSLDYPV